MTVAALTTPLGDMGFNPLLVRLLPGSDNLSYGLGVDLPTVNDLPFLCGSSVSGVWSSLLSEPTALLDYFHTPVNAARPSKATLTDPPTGPATDVSLNCDTITCGHCRTHADSPCGVSRHHPTPGFYRALVVCAFTSRFRFRGVAVARLCFVGLYDLRMFRSVSGSSP
jgi:hypothetical protein